MRILSCDDHELFRVGLRHALAELEESVEFEEVVDGRELTARLGRDPELDLVLLDLGLPGEDGLETLRELARLRCPLASGTDS